MGAVREVIAMATLAAALGASSAAAYAEGPVAHRTPAEIFGVLEASAREYRAAPLEDLKDIPVGSFAEKLWPAAAVGGGGWPWVRTDPGGRRALVYRAADPEATKQLEKGETAFQERRYMDALELWRPVAARFPDDPKVQIYLGDAWFFLRRYDEALAAYERAAALNPADYQAQLFRAHALYRLGHKPEALEGWVRTLMLRPRQETALKLLAGYAGDLGIEVRPTGFEPRAFVRREGETTAMYTVPEAPWLAWAACKAAWLSEPTFREAKGVPPGSWSQTEETECIAGLYALYATARADGSAAKDDVIERVSAAVDANLLSAFVLYEIGARVNPDLTLLLDDTAQDEIARYVRTFVVPKRKTGP